MVFLEAGNSFTGFITGHAVWSSAVIAGSVQLSLNTDNGFFVFDFIDDHLGSGVEMAAFQLDILSVDHADRIGSGNNDRLRFRICRHGRVDRNGTGRSLVRDKGINTRRDVHTDLEHAAPGGVQLGVVDQIDRNSSAGAQGDILSFFKNEDRIVGKDLRPGRIVLCGQSSHHAGSSAVFRKYDEFSGRDGLSHTIIARTEFILFQGRGISFRSFFRGFGRSRLRGRRDLQGTLLGKAFCRCSKRSTKQQGGNNK